MRKHKQDNVSRMRHPAGVSEEPRTGVGTPDEHAQAAGAELGGDTGDVGMAWTHMRDNEKDTQGASGAQTGSTVMPENGLRAARMRRRSGQQAA